MSQKISNSVLVERTQEALRNKNIDLSAAKVSAVFSTASDIIRDEVKQGNSVTFEKLGVFKPTARAARTSRNPRTGDPIQVSAKQAPVFKASVPFKDFVK